MREQRCRKIRRAMAAIQPADRARRRCATAPVVVASSWRRTSPECDVVETVTARGPYDVRVDENKVQNGSRQIGEERARLPQIGRLEAFRERRVERAEHVPGDVTLAVPAPEAREPVHRAELPPAR